MPRSAFNPAPLPAGPPGPPPPRDAHDYSAGFRWSVIIHAVFLTAVVIKSLVFPGGSKPYIPTLRVDIVGLPDILKKDLSAVPKESASLDQIKEALKRADDQLRLSKEMAKQALAKEAKAKAAEKAKTAEPDEMLVKPRTVTAKPDGNTGKTRQKKMKDALARLKALERIRSEAAPSPSNTKTQGILIKGNKVSHGTQLSGEARESEQANYYDSLRSRLQDNWALPVWVARQKLSAQVQIFIDGRGRLRTYRFIKLSGNAQFDGAVKQCLSDSQPFPLPPESLSSSILVDGILIGFPL
ncbi:MAG TPA: hypothetical protein DCS07_05190 [Bdellovibrionales bacterium]|nr:MAG: hypothetical protein A2Z97_01645 [Bdellovibrionales bacterium GWB1_52_6]OFZ05041.1 MAG: hypothetical protein A2X97_00405 [Bdellovibrionales bacterium GWA1_52_35]OFZ43270.1 MAG: hypothetical protein A2070_12885 [Bdellovibrionales bacterium GWC1_52_8]HAR42014.1 hypothetical protein [Bdellovibrionales bacterium]HCM41276.1 hypothetical protein [Bdellovibrionales bacterium]